MNRIVSALAHFSTSYSNFAIAISSFGLKNQFHTRYDDLAWLFASFSLPNIFLPFLSALALNQIGPQSGAAAFSLIAIVGSFIQFLAIDLVCSTFVIPSITVHLKD
jgi:hypothetical protein